MEKHIIEKNNSIEEIFCIPFGELKKHQMDDEISELFIKLCMNEKKFNIPENEKPFLFKIIEKRLECFDFKIESHALILFIVILSETPGTAIMYLWYLQYWTNKNNIETLTFDKFSTDVFPWGFPSDNDLSDLWKKQKVYFSDEQKKTLKGTGSDNLLDYQKAGLSIFKK